MNKLREYALIIINHEFLKRFKKIRKFYNKFLKVVKLRRMLN